MVTRNGNLCSLSYKDWRLLIGKKERLTNEQKSKEDILKQVKREKDPEKKYPHRAILYIHTHKANTTKNTNPHVVQFSSNLYWFKIFIDVWTIFQRINFRRLQNVKFHGIMQTLIICIELKKIKVADTRQGKLQRTDRLATTHKVKRKDMQSATTFDKTKCATTSKTGAQVFLKSWRCPTKAVALGTVLGRDPNHKVEVLN
ncbi:hypothetical protein ZEAMMB73_Zm00001d004645 [Zea mays]|uniref:Uncharacterized protein n=1 Tax=Zea mays TaxID=4577 RepID=A0A1D6EGN1_MAIZE|nr:hypothetical protein ZEAMMB73_Zm00001d004645 [Zea mays]